MKFLNSVMLTKAAHSVTSFLTKNSHVIAAGLGITCAVGAVGMAINETLKVNDVICTAETKKNEEAITKHRETGGELEYVPLTKKEKGLLYAKLYWPTVLLLIASITCVCGSVYFANRKTKALAVLCTAAESTLREYQTNTELIAGKKKAQMIDEKTNTEAMQRASMSETGVVQTGKGNYLFYDKMSGRYFRSSANEIDKQMNSLNTELRVVGFVSVNRYYEGFGLKGLPFSNTRGWVVSMIPDMEIAYDIQYAGAENGEPCGVIVVRTAPSEDGLTDIEKNPFLPF